MKTTTESHPTFPVFPCYNSISKCSKIAAVTNAIGIIKEGTTFFNQSAKRNQVLKEIIGGQLLQLCEIRWVERHNAIIAFYSFLPELVEAFAKISE